MPPLRFVLARFALLAAAVCLTPGCGDSAPKTFLVTGKVTHKGEPLPNGAIMFVPAEGPAGSATIEPDGAFEVQLVSGTHRVAVIAMTPRQGRPDPSKEGGLDTTGFPDPVSLVPKKYNEYASSGIQVEVKESGENKFEIELP